MQHAIEWLLNLDQISLQDVSRLNLQWQEPIEAWLWFIIILVVTAYVFMIYRRDGGGVKVRAAMAGLRGLLIILAILLLCEPAVVYRRDRIEPSTVAILMDHSASMAREDHYPVEEWEQLARLQPGGQGAQSCSRWELARAIFAQDNYALINNLLERHQVRFFEFADSASNVSHVKDSLEAAAVSDRLSHALPTGSGTNIARSISQVLEACIDAHLAGVVLITDGQPTQDEDWEKLIHTLEARGTSVHVVPLGSPELLKDLAIVAAKLESHAYLHDKVAVKFAVRSSGLAPSTPFEVLLRNVHNAGDVLASKLLRVLPEEHHQAVELQFEPPTVGLLQLVLEIPPVPGELETTNNAQQLQVTVVDDQVKVLYVEGYPRYEYRYLKNTLILEPTVVVSTLLLSADADFAQEGNEPIRRFPNTAEELDEYDVILFGDVDPRTGWITEAQLDLIVEFVTRKGGGFGLIAGERYTPQRFYGTAIERLIPVELGGGIDEQLKPPDNVIYSPQLTAAGRESPLFRLLLDEKGFAAVFDRLPRWYWVWLVRGNKPGTEVLVEHPTLQHHQAHLPVVVVGRHGAGTVFYQGSDDSWRWRRYRGEAFFDTYWLQVVRYLARNKKFQRPTGVTLRTNRRTIDPQQAVVISLEFDDAAVVVQLPDSVAVDIRTAQGIKLDEAWLTRLTANSKRFQGSYLPKEVGQLEVLFATERYSISLADVGTFFEVNQESLENRNPEANIELMRGLAKSTDGSVVPPWEAASLYQVIPDRKYIVPDDLVETIWDSRLALILFVLLIAMEWILRKLSGLT